MNSFYKTFSRVSIYSLALIAICALLPFASYAQDSNLGNWMIYIGSKKVNTKWNLHHEVQYRNYNVVGDLEQLLLRTGMGYSLTDNSNLLLGYGFIRSENYQDNSDDKTIVNEHRIFQQFITKAKINKLGLQHRYRFEQRFVEDDFKVRFRYFLGLTLPISSDNDKTYLSAYNEIFLNSRADVYDRNRTYFGLGYKLNSTLKVELGYMNQFLNKGNRDQLNIIVFGSF